MRTYSDKRVDSQTLKVHSQCLFTYYSYDSYDHFPTERQVVHESWPQGHLDPAVFSVTFLSSLRFLYIHKGNPLKPITWNRIVS